MTKTKTILITGASRGIGLLTSKTCAQAGHHVIAAIRDTQTRNAETVLELNSWARYQGYKLETMEKCVRS